MISTKVSSLVFCRPGNVVLQIVMSTITVVWLVSSLPLLFLHDAFASRHLHIQMLRNDYTVPTRCRHRRGMVDPPGDKACKALTADQPSNQILCRSVQNHPKAVSFLSSGVPSWSGLTTLNPTVAHTQSPHLASIVPLARFVIIDFSAEITTKPSAHNIDRGLILSNA
jgi:hypothetical protein